MKPRWIMAVARLRRRPSRTLDGGNASRWSIRYGVAGGFTVIELVVTAGLLSVLLGIALINLPRTAYGLQDGNARLIADLRLSRNDALAKGDHFRLRVITKSTYSEYRMALQNDGTWAETGNPVRSRTLPTKIEFSGGVGSSFEFNTRGLLVTPDAAATLTLQDKTSNHTRQVTVWPSGQVAAL
jgi:type II secretory pathway pseudopilin PulG